MKTQILLIALAFYLFGTEMKAQNRTIINANSAEISDNLDLRVVASLFGDSNNLQEFETKLNDPRQQLSNLDLNNDYQVDYLRVIESVTNRAHFIVIQAVLGRDLYQDVATIEVEKNRYNEVAIQIVGNSYLYGNNYIYEPVYYRTPSIYVSFWVSSYRPYCSTWSWNFYPKTYYAWNPCPVYRYRRNVDYCLNTFYEYDTYHYTPNRRCSASNYGNYAANAYEKQHPYRSFSRRNASVNNRFELEQQRNYGENYNQQNTYVSRTNNYQRMATSRNFNYRENNPRQNEGSGNYVSRENKGQRVEYNRNYSNQENNSRQNEAVVNYGSRENALQKREFIREYSTNDKTSNRNDATRNYSQNGSQRSEATNYDLSSQNRGTVGSANTNGNRGGRRF